MSATIETYILRPICHALRRVVVQGDSVADGAGKQAVENA